MGFGCPSKMFLLIGGADKLGQTLILTNGDCAASLLTEAGIDGRVEPWRDSLHEGPLYPLQSLEDFTRFQQGRSAYWAARGVDDIAPLQATYQQRDDLIAHHATYDRIELWFEHDLYDQLQLIEILTRLYQLKRFEGVHLVQAETYLGMQQADQILNLNALRLDVDERMMAIADLAWQTVAHTSPTKMAEFVPLKPAGFPFLTLALKRFLEELPGPDGLSRTERQMIYSLNRGVTRAGLLFGRCQAMEAAQFWGDLGFFTVLSDLQFCAAPLLTGLPQAFEIALFQDGEARKGFLQAELALTELGGAVLAGAEDFCAHIDIDRFVGGTHVTQASLWRWDWERGALLSPQPVH